MKTILITGLLLVLSLLTGCQTAEVKQQFAHNPLIWADVPDPALLRVGDTYYMSSTTMHMNPGLPIMKSRDLVNWEMASYAYPTLSNDDKSSLNNGKEAYGEGTWASSLRYHNGRYYVSSFSNTTKKTYIFSTDKIESGNWQRVEIDALLHDSSLFFDDGRVFMIYGNDDIHIIELTSDATAIKKDGVNRILIPKASRIAGDKFWVPSEGSQMLKVNGKYYLNLISWPANKMRTQLIYRSDTLLGTYEGRVALTDKGIAQGGLIDTPDGKWYAFLFRDRGAVGRIPYLVPVHWQDGWPIYGVNGKVPDELPIQVSHQGFNNIIESDEFDYATNQSLKMAWQWNHNPVAEGWSLTDRKGFLRLTNLRLDKSFVETQNTLTQRTFGPVSTAYVLLDTSNMKAGDYAGLGALQSQYGFVGVEKTSDAVSIVMASGDPKSWKVVERIPLTQSQVHVKVYMDFRDRKDVASFGYSLDGVNWSSLGSTLAMKYSLDHFMGYRFGLFNFATQETGGSADFDFYRIE
jgi:xylan 1,4-beta-xylosidase